MALTNGAVRIVGLIGFNNTPPIAKPIATPAEASDLATAIALLNYLRTNVIVAYGLAA